MIEDINERMTQFAPSQNNPLNDDPIAEEIAIARQVTPQPDAATIDVDPIAEEIAQSRRDLMMATFGSAAEANPDQAAQAKKLGEQFGVGADIAGRNMQQLKKQALLDELERRDLMRRDPILARYLSNHDFAAMAHDDIDNLAKTEDLFQGSWFARYEDPIAYGKKTISMIDERFRRGRAIVEMGRANDLLGLRAQWSPDPRKASEISEELKKLTTEGGIVGAGVEVVGQMLEGIPEVAETTAMGATAGGAVGAVGGPAGFLTIPAGMLTGAGAGFAAGSARSAFMAESGNSYQQMIEQGYDPEVARKAAIGVGVVNASIEMISFGALGPVLRRLGVNVFRPAVANALAKPTAAKALATLGSDYAKAVAAGASEEFLQEIATGIGDDIARVYGSSSPSRILDEGGITELLGTALESGVQGAMGMAILGGVGPVANFRYDMRRAGAAERQQAFFERLSSTAVDSKLRGRDMNAFERFVASQAEGTEAETIFVDAAAMQGVLRQSNLSDEQIDEALPGVREQLQAAAQTGGDVTLPTASFAARVAGTDLGNAMLPHVRLAPDAMSVTEAQEFQKNRDQLVEQARVIMEEKGRADDAFVQEAQAIEDRIYQEVVATGTMDENAARANATFVRDLYVTMAARMNTTPAALEQRFPYRVEAQGVAITEPLEQASRLMYPSLAKAWDRYNSGERYMTVGDLADKIESLDLAGKRIPQSVLDAVQDFRNAQREEREIYGERGGTADDAGNALEIAVQNAAEQVRENPIQPNIMEQAATVDAEYMAAVERGDMETAQRMVDAAAKAAGYTVGPVYHGTFAKFNEFDLYRATGNDLGFHFGDNAAAENRLFDLRQEQPQRFAKAEQRILRVRLRMENPLRLQETRRNAWQMKDVLAQIFDGDTVLPGFEQDLDAYLGDELESRVGGKWVSYADLSDNRADQTEWLGNLLLDKGYDGVVYENRVEGGTSYIVYDPNRIKLADPVTSDEAGNVIPLSRRFDITSPRIFEQAAVPTSLDAVANVESAFAFAGTRAFKTNREFKQELQDRVVAAAKEAGIDLSKDTPEVEQYLVRVAVADAITALRTNPNAVGWYNEKVTKALRLVSLIHPEIATDPRAKFAFTWALAVTSNGLEVNKNFQLAERVYREYKQTGQMPTNVQAGQAQIAINASLGLFNDLVAKYGIDAVEKFMTTKTTVKEVMAYTNKNVSGENLTTEVYGAAALGPKIGNGFFANLYGYFEQLTMDRWLMRTWGRWTGTLLDDNTANIATKRKQLTAMIRALSAEDKKALEKILGSKLSTTKPDEVAVAIQKISMKPANRVAMAKIGPANADAQAVFSSILGEPARGIQRVSYGDELRKLGNALAKYLDGQKEAPSGPPERARIRRVMSKVLAELQTQFPSLTMSDLQALLWYPEKRLYDAAKTADEGKTGYEDNEAPDYANAAANLARASGVAESVISDTIASVDAELSAISAERAAGAERGIGNLVLRQDAQSARAGFEQAARGPARGGFDPSRLTTILNKNADLSTFIHETAHFYLTILGNLAADPAATPEIRADMDTLLKWFGIAGDTDAARLAAWNALSVDQQRKYHEQFAYSFEVYMFEGKSPSAEMQGLFDRFSAWLKRVYRSIQDDLNAIYRREFGEDLPLLTGEVRQVMDRMLASEEQIKRQAAINEMKPMFQTQEQSGMDDAEWAAYQQMQQEAVEAAVTDMNKASLRQMQWLSNARARILRDLQAKHAKQRKEIREEVAEEIRRQPLYRAMEYLRTGTFTDADGESVKMEGAHRLDMESVRQMYSLEPENLRPDIAKLGTGGRGMMGMNGIDPDVAAELFGFSSGDELIRALIEAQPMKEAIDARTDEVMLERFSELSTPEGREAKVQESLHNEARARFVAVELRFVAKATQPARVLVEAAKQAAREMIAGKRIADLRPSEFIAAEARAARSAAKIGKPVNVDTVAKAAETRAMNIAREQGLAPDEVLAAGVEAGAIAQQAAQARLDEQRAQYGADPAQALIRAKRAQLYQNQLAAEALAARDEVEKGVRYLRQVMRDSNVKRMGADVADQIDRILERFNLRPMSAKRMAERQSLVQWLESLKESGLEPDLAPEILDEAARKPYREMTVAEFRDLVDAVKQLEYIGKNAQKIKRAQEMAEFEEVRDEIVASVRGNFTGKETKPRTPTTSMGKRIAKAKRFLYSHLKAAAIARIMDGGQDDGPVWNFLIRTANEAGDMETRMRAEATKRLTEILAPVFALGKMGGKGIYFDTVGMSLNREARLVIALNMGNDGNRQRLLDGEGWTLEQVQPILESLTEAEWKAVQDVWDYMESFRPLVGAKERRLYGREPKWVTPVPFTVRTADGKEVRLSGGYYPIKYDPVATERAETADEAEKARTELRGAYTAATTRRSFTKARAAKVEDRPLLYTMTGVYSGINDVIHDLAWHEWLIQANRLMRDEKFDRAVRETYGAEFKSQLKGWIKDVAAGERGAEDAADMFASYIRRSVSAAGLGFNIVSAILQVTGFSQSIVRVGAKHIARGVAATTASPLQTMKFVNEKSSFMQERARTQFRELNELRNMVGDESAAQRRLRLGTYFLMMRMQRMVDVPTWVGAYEKALEAGKDDATAVALADQAVIDSQGGGMLKDLSKIERGGALSKLFTVFYSYMNTVYNMAAVSTMTPRSKGRLAADYAMLFIVPVVLNYALKKALTPDVDDEEPDMEKIATDLVAEELAFLMGTMVGVREFQNAANAVVGKETAARGYEGPAGLRAIGEAGRFAVQAKQLEFDRAFRRSAINMLGIGLGLPSAQINRTIDGVEALAEGETENPFAVLTGVQR